MVDGLITPQIQN